MTREDVIRMAREAGLIDPDLGECVTDFGDATDSIQKFASLIVAEQERILVAAYQVAMYQVAAEREACAAICDAVARRYGEGPEVEHWAQGFKKGASVSAKKIRARGQE